MRIKSVMLFALGSLGIFSSCKTQDIYNKAQNKQYELVANERAIIDKNKTSVLVPNGPLSSKVGDNVAYFLSKNDSVAFDEQLRLAHGIVTDVQAKKTIALRDIANDYDNKINALNSYYNAERNKKPGISELYDLEAYYRKETKSINEHYDYLKKAVEQEYSKAMKNAKRMKTSIVNKACKMRGVIIEKGGARL